MMSLQAEAEVMTHWRSHVDVGVALLLTTVALFARFLPEGDVFRLLLTIPMILFVPGYLLLQGLMTGARKSHAIAAIGISPALVGLLALSTTLLPQGFQATQIVTVITLACFALAGLALWRRGAFERPGPAPA